MFFFSCDFFFFFFSWLTDRFCHAQVMRNKDINWNGLNYKTNLTSTDQFTIHVLIFSILHVENNHCMGPVHVCCQRRADFVQVLWISVFLSAIEIDNRTHRLMVESYWSASLTCAAHCQFVLWNLCDIHWHRLVSLIKKGRPIGETQP